MNIHHNPDLIKKMKKSEISVLITGAGGAGSLGRELMKAFNLAKQKYRIVVTNSSPISVGLFETNRGYVVPPATSRNYIQVILDICKKEKIDALVGGSEPEIEKLVKNLKIFEENNIVVLSNSLNVIRLCSDKLRLINFLTSKKILCPKTFSFIEDHDINKIDSYPVIIKPRKGSGSRNVFLANDKSEAKFFANYLKKYGSCPLIQEYVDSHNEEFTIGVLYVDDGKLITSIAMKRILEGNFSTRQIIQLPHTKKKSIISSGISQGFFDNYEEITKSGEKIAEVLKANGPINIQCRQTENGLSIFEINPRFSGTTASRSLVGHNEPDMLCRYRLFGETVMPKHKVGYVMKDLREKYISLDNINKLIRL